ncbi:Glycogen debranching enzyme [Venustampulla echinocandica]|uniref:Glycogen debranching enzyme n=1 Tax=Venustampulla echinocandica TaxID=2656787 RepID=A0A370T9K9_9HELO|nr:Glycogen debranching enzyme [Venustampulla echinocandica]RDL30331.1 Glycogen debranching enzyme [Venustampulla echinocandica]
MKILNWKVAWLLCNLLSPHPGGTETLSLQQCGEQFYYPSNYTCFDGNFLCPIEDRTPTLKCGGGCYLPDRYSCQDNNLVSSPTSNGQPTTNSTTGIECNTTATRLYLSSPPYDNYFYSDCHAQSQVVVTTPLSDSNLTVIGPRVIVAWPAGNSGIVAYFAPENGINGTLGIRILNSTSGNPLEPIYQTGIGNGNATVGISAQLEFNSSVVLSVAILGSIRTIRDFTEGPSLLHPEIQNAINYSSIDSGIQISRLWLDNITTTTLSFSSSSQSIHLDNTTVKFKPGTYTFNASFNYPQLTQLSSEMVLSPESVGLIEQLPSQTTSLSFLSYTTKLTAGAWRFLTYFGRDSMMAALLLEPVLSKGKDGAMEAVLAGVLERINRTDGSVCHEETIGDYATWTNLQDNITSAAPLCDYKMIDSDYFLPVLMERYFLENGRGSQRASEFLNTVASTLPVNSNLTYKQLAQVNAEKIVNLSAPFAAQGNQTKENLMHLKDGQIVGEWRDSTYGIGGGRIPYDVNTALVPAALRSISSLSSAGILDFNPTIVDEYAQIWEDSTLQFFEILVDLSTAKSSLQKYAADSGVLGLKSQADTLDGNVTFYALALDGNDNLSQVAVMNTDDCFRHFFLNTTNQPQLTTFLNATANNIRRTFPAGLMTDVGMVVANPAYGQVPVYATNFTTSAYHGTVVWSWPLAMMARGFELQLDRCNSSTVPDFCGDSNVYSNVKMAYNTLWDSIEANSAHLSTEVWSWTYGGGKFSYIDLGALPPPPGNSPTESDIVQLWSLTFLAIIRDEKLR